VKLVNLGGATTVTANGIETINIDSSNAGTALSASAGLTINNTNATNKAAVVATGAQTLAFGSGGITADINSINASGMTGALVMNDSARAGSAAMTITGGSAADTIVMRHANDVLEGNSGADTLKLNFNAVLGGFAVDLSSTVDQFTTFNGSANAAIQKGFENVNLSLVTGNFGADITANSAGSTITATSNNDVITGGAGADVITGGNGNDTIDLTSGGADTVVFGTFGGATAITANANADTVNGFVAGSGTGADKLSFGTGASTAVAANTLVMTTSVAHNAGAGALGGALNTAGGGDIATQSIVVITTITGGTMTAGILEAGLENSNLAGAGYVVVVDSATSARVFYDNNFNAGTDGSALALVGTLNGTSLTSFVLANVLYGT
jgi:hypothetical protein